MQLAQLLCLVDTLPRSISLLALALAYTRYESLINAGTRWKRFFFYIVPLKGPGTLHSVASRSRSRSDAPLLSFIQLML